MIFRKKGGNDSSDRIDKENDLHKLKRIDLLELLLEQGKELEALQSQVKDLEQQLADRKITLEETGSIAEASLELNHVIEAAQKAAEQYLDNVTRNCLEKEQKTEEHCRDMEEKVTANCRAMEEKTTANCRAMEEETTANCRAMEEEAAANCRAMEEKAAANCRAMEQETASRCRVLEREIAERCKALGQEISESCKALERESVRSI